MAEYDTSYSSWTVEQLKAFLRERRILLSGNKKELVQKVLDIAHTDRLEEDIKALPFQNAQFSPPPSFDELANDHWIGDDLPLVTESSVTTYLKATLRTFAQGFVYASVDICLIWRWPNQVLRTTYIKAKCRPTMRKTQHFTHFLL